MTDHWEWVGMAAGVLGLAVILGAQAYHVVFRPEWTNVQALRGLWYLWLIGVALVGVFAWSERRKQ